MSLEFQRLARVRARRHARRKRWFRVLSILAVAAAVVAASQLLAPMLPGRLLASLLEDHFSLLNGDAPPVGEAREAHGRVDTVDPRTRIIHVSSGVFGFTSVALVVGSDTIIVVGDKEGGFGDLREGEQVKAAYEVRRDVLQAKRVEVLVRRSPLASPTSLR